MKEARRSSPEDPSTQVFSPQAEYLNLTLVEHVPEGLLAHQELEPVFHQPGGLIIDFLEQDVVAAVDRRIPPSLPLLIHFSALCARLSD